MPRPQTLLQPSRLGASEFTALTSAATVVYLGLKAAARGPSLFFASLLLYPLGGMNRGCAVDALHTRHALAAGMSRCGHLTTWTIIQSNDPNHLGMR